MADARCSGQSPISGRHVSRLTERSLPLLMLDHHAGCVIDDVAIGDDRTAGQDDTTALIDGASFGIVSVHHNNAAGCGLENLGRRFGVRRRGQDQ